MVQAGDSGRLAENRRRRGKGESEGRQLNDAMSGYAQAVRVLDGGEAPGDLAAAITKNGLTPVEGVTGLIFALRDVLRLRGWLRDAPIVIDQPAHLQGWSPRLADDPPRLRLVLDLERVDIAQLAALWVGQRERLQVTIRLMSRQLALGEAPAAHDLEALMAGHDGGLHEEQPDWACPACLLRAAEQRLIEQAAEAPDLHDSVEGREPKPPAGEERPPPDPLAEST